MSWTWFCSSGVRRLRFRQGKICTMNWLFISFSSQIIAPRILPIYRLSIDQPLFMETRPGTESALWTLLQKPWQPSGHVEAWLLYSHHHVAQLSIETCPSSNVHSLLSLGEGCLWSINYNNVCVCDEVTVRWKVCWLFWGGLERKRDRGSRAEDHWVQTDYTVLSAADHRRVLPWSDSSVCVCVCVCYGSVCVCVCVW